MTDKPLGLENDQLIPQKDGKTVFTEAQLALITFLCEGDWGPDPFDCWGMLPAHLLYITIHHLYLVPDTVLELVIEELRSHPRTYLPPCWPTIRQLTRMCRAAMRIAEWAEG
ncbi:MAG: hypothetical protein ACRDHZ_01525 [Ktedonobacteraceae bacterium]